MVVLTPRFAALLLLVATAHAAFVPQRPASQAPFHVRSTPDAPSSLYSTYGSTLNPFRNPLFFRRSAPAKESSGRKSSGKKPSGKKHGKESKAKAPSTTAPVPDSAKPKSDRKAATSSTQNNVAAMRGKHASGEHHRDNKGGKHGKSKGHKSKGHKSGKSRGHKAHKDKRDLAGEDVHHPRTNSRLFTRLDAPVRYYAKEKKDVIVEARHETDEHSHDHDRKHRHRDLDLTLDDLLPILDSRDPQGSEGWSEDEDPALLEVNLKRGHDDDDDDDNDGDHHHHHHHHHARQTEDSKDVPEVEVELNLKRDHDDHRHHHHHHHHDKKETIVEPGHPLVLLDVGHQNFGKHITYHVHGRRQHHRRIADHIHARHDNHDNVHDHVHEYKHEHIHEHKHGRRAGSAGVRMRSHEHDHKHEHIHENIHEHKHEHKHGRRDSNSGVPGAIQVVSPAENGKHVKIANLVLTGTDNATSAAPSNASFVLNASNDTHTQVFLVAADSSPSKGKTVNVALHVVVYDPMQVKDVPYCVTYDPSPSAPGPLAVTSCGQSSEHQSQLFEYTPGTGSVRPLWTSASSPDAGDAGAANAASQDSSFARQPIANEVDATAANLTSANSTSSANSTAPSTATAASSTASSNATSSSDTPRTVALMFQPDDPQDPKASAESNPDDGVEDPNAASGKLSNWPDAYRNGQSTSFYPQSAPDNNTTSTSMVVSTATDTTTSITTTTMDSAAALATSTSSASTVTAPTTSSSTASSTATGSATSSSAASAADVTSSTATTTSTDPSATTSSTTVTDSSSTAPPARAVDAAAPYEYMFTPEAHK